MQKGQKKDCQPKCTLVDTLTAGQIRITEVSIS